MQVKLPDFLCRDNNFNKYILQKNKSKNISDKPDLSHSSKKRFKLKFVDKGLIKTSGILKMYFDNTTISSKKNYLNIIPAKVKLICLTLILIIISLSNTIEYQLIISGFLISLNLVFLIQLKEKNIIWSYIKKIIYPTILLGFLLSLPASINLITKGEELINLIQLNKEYKFWIYKIPDKIFISKEGIKITFLITLRVFNSITISMLILQSEPIEKIINSLKVLGIPTAIRTILLITQKYILIFSRTVEKYYFSLRSRLFTEPKKSQLYEITGSRAFLLYKKTKEKFYDISLALRSRGINNI